MSFGNFPVGTTNNNATVQSKLYCNRLHCLNTELNWSSASHMTSGGDMGVLVQRHDKTNKTIRELNLVSDLHRQTDRHTRQVLYVLNNMSIDWLMSIYVQAIKKQTPFEITDLSWLSINLTSDTTTENHQRTNYTERTANVNAQRKIYDGISQQLTWWQLGGLVSAEQSYTLMYLGEDLARNGSFHIRLRSP